MKQFEMTQKEKLDNFWFYNKWKVIVIGFIAILVLSFVKDMVTRVHYDYTVAVLSDTMYFENETLKLQEVFEKYGEDRNGNGKVDVEILSYSMIQVETVDPQTLAAVQAKFTADMQEGISMIFLFSDSAPEIFAFEELPWEEPHKLTEYEKLYEALQDTKMADYSITMRKLEGTTVEGDAELEAYYYDSEELLESLR